MSTNATLDEVTISCPDGSSVTYGVIPILDTTCTVTNVDTAAVFGDLQSAHDAAALSGHTLEVRGTCYGTTTLSKNLTINGISGPAWGPATLDGAGSTTARILEFAPNSTGAPRTNLDGLTITNGAAGGIHCFKHALRMSNMTVTGNASATAGAGVSLDECRGTTITTSVFTDNHSTFSGSNLRGGGAIHSERSLSSITHSTFSGNSARHGAALHTLEDTGAVLDNVTMTDNQAGEFGGGISTRYAFSPTLTNSTITGNSAGTTGGGIYKWIDALPVTVDPSSTVTGNTPNDCAGQVC